MSLSFLYSVFNRTELFRNTLESFLEQEGREEIEYEILVIDDAGTDGELLPLAKEFRQKGIPIRYARVDISGYTAYPIYKMCDGANNPSVPMNIGLRLIKTHKVVLSSPEIRHSKPTNLGRLSEFPLQPKQWLCCDVWDDKLKMFMGGGPGHKPLNFLSLHNVEDLHAVGGIYDEKFMGGWAWDDVDLSHRLQANDIQAVFSGDAITGFHQYHIRPGIDEMPPGFMIAWNINKDICTKLKERKIANIGHYWGNLGFVKETWQ
jgi:hypothetical protein